MLGHLKIASSTLKEASDLQSGQNSGILNGAEFFGLLSEIDLIIFGITSPARSTMTVSPILISYLSISS